MADHNHRNAHLDTSAFEAAIHHRSFPMASGEMDRSPTNDVWTPPAPGAGMGYPSEMC
jgi:hypothetical protein